MRCRICGKQIANGTICDECYKDAMEKNSENEDRKVLMKIGRKFSPKYHIISNWELLLLCILFLICAITLKRISFIIVSVFLDLFLILFSLFISKRIANGTKCYFFENKVVYKFDFLFIHRKVIFKYSDLQDIIYGYDLLSGYSMFYKMSFRRFLQQKFNMGDIGIYAKKTGIIQKSIIIKDVGNIVETFEKLTNTIGEKLDS